MKYCAVIFDLDGTLLDTSEGIIYCYQQTAVTHGLPIMATEIIKKNIGGNLRQCFKDMYGNINIVDELVLTYREIYKETGIYQARMYEELYETLAELQKLGLKLGVATLKLESLAKLILEHFNILQYFEVVCGADEKNMLKKFDIIRNCLTQLNILDYTKAVMIGDSEHDAVGAENVGIDFIGVTYGFGFRSESDVKKHRNAICVKDIKSLFSIFSKCSANYPFPAYKHSPI